MKLSVRVNDELLLDAGTTEALSASELVIHPPTTTLFEQVLGYLRAKPDPRGSPNRSTDGYEGSAAAAVALRWGSYLTVLADRTKPVWAETRSPEAGRISDLEMARINIEASAALAQWIDISRADRSLYEKLARRALAHCRCRRCTQRRRARTSRCSRCPRWRPSWSRWSPRLVWRALRARPAATPAVSLRTPW